MTDLTTKQIVSLTLEASNIMIKNLVGWMGELSEGQIAEYSHGSDDRDRSATTDAALDFLEEVDWSRVSEEQRDKMGDFLNKVFDLANDFLKVNFKED